MVKDYEKAIQFKKILQQQEESVPPEAVKQRLMAEIHRPALPLLSNPARLALGVAITFLIAFSMWLVIQPGVVFSWQSDHDFAYYQVYRSPAGQENYLPVSEIKPAQKGAEYRFIDPLVVPGRTYQYLVEGVTPGGQSVYRQAVSAGTTPVLLAQAAILASSVVLTWILVLLVSAPRPFRMVLPARLISHNK